MQIVCVKIGSLSEFETYLLADRFGLDYFSLKDIRADKTVKKYWIDSTDGRLLAVERDIYGEREFDQMTILTPQEISAIKKTKPVLAGEPTRKFKGDVEAKREEFKLLLDEDRKYRESMLSRDYDPSDIVCINAKSTLQQVFAVCVENDVEPVSAISFLYGNGHLEMTRVWFEKKTGVLVAYSYCDEHTGEEHFLTVDCLIPKKAISRMSHSPVKTPRLKCNEASAKSYSLLKNLGIDLGIDKLEKFNFVKKRSDFLSDLRQRLQEAIDEEDYEEAAILRDRIKAIENGNEA